jgi:hypothetical protein
LPGEPVQNTGVAVILVAKNRWTRFGRIHGGGDFLTSGAADPGPNISALPNISARKARIPAEKIR